MLDGEGCYAIPGLIDLHFHGCMGYDFVMEQKKPSEKIAKYEASIGVTAISPATMALPVEELEKYWLLLLNIEEAGKRAKRRKVLKRGRSHRRKYGRTIYQCGRKVHRMKEISLRAMKRVYQRFLDASKGLVKYVELPERNEDAVSFIRAMKDKVNISLAHTNAGYDAAMEAFNAGANHAVHLYNAMPAFTHIVQREW